MLMQIDLLGLNRDEPEWYQMLIRAFIVFVIAIAFIRIAGMRSFGTQSAFDVVLSITLGSLLSDSITGERSFFPTLSAALFLALLHRFSARLAYWSGTMSDLLEGSAVPLYKNKKKITKNLAKHSVSDKDMTQALHEHGLEDYEKADTIWLEPDGKISIVKKEEK